MIHPSTALQLVDEHIGHGVFATRFIPRGTITWARDSFDHVFSAQQVRVMDRLHKDVLEKYSFIDGRGDFVLCWDLGRSVNHSCDPNSLSAGYDFEIATRDIQEGEELTDDYGTLNVKAPFACRCGSPRCRRRVEPDDLLHFSDGWDATLRAAFPHIVEVSQPLWELISDPGSVEAAAANPALLASCRLNYAPGAAEIFARSVTAR